MLDPKNSAVIMEDDDLEVSTIILNHRIPCTGFLLKEKPRSRKLQKDKLQKFNVPISVYQDLKNGMDYTDEFGKVIAN